MAELYNSFLSKTFLRSVWGLEYEAFKDSPEETALDERLRRWSDRKDLRETSAEAAFIEEFFHRTWGYAQSGQPGTEDGAYTLWPKFSIPGAGATGGTGEADAALGLFRKNTDGAIPQVLCEFKDIRSNLDAPQRRKGNNRSPVRQCLDYLAFARRGLFPSDPILPTWGIVTDMNEFRLYRFDKGHHQSLRFTIRATDLLQTISLIGNTDAARFERFLFRKIFHRDTLVAVTGRSELLALIGRQRFRDRQLESSFYAEYRKFREKLYGELLLHNGPSTSRFPGTKGRLVRLAQKILDRSIFVFFCEDMGSVLAFPPKLFQEFLIDRSKDPYFDPDGTTIWQDVLRLFDAMNEGRAFGGKPINQFNGGLFDRDVHLEGLHVPNSVFCQHLQGSNEASLYSHKETLLYLCASYNYASDIGRGNGREFDRDPAKSLGLYTLGRIFEQSITELEILEAEADGRPSVNKLSKRKRDGVYYTPEWVVERIVDETLGPRLTEIKRECGWPDSGEPSLATIDAYSARLKALTVLDPACGSGAFLITALRYLVDEWHQVQGLRRQVTRRPTASEDDAELIAEILKANLYGVDINAASVEIAQLALWLHTARGNKPLSSLQENIREGNSLIGPDFFKGQINLALYSDSEKERVNAFDWQSAFPQVFERGGFDAVVSNPPYVKLQNFRAAHEDMAEFLREGRPGVVLPPYASTQTGNFDLYLPFIEKGISLLNDHGRLGYIAPSLWTTNEYGEGLRDVVGAGRNLDRWIDFKSHQNLDKHEIVKLIVPRLVENFACSVDETASFYLDNVDVGGLVIATGHDPFFIAGVLNSLLVNFVFKRISKPFRGNYLSANKQFIAPLPIPPASPEERAAAAESARALQVAHTRRRDTLVRIERRLSAVRLRSRPETWLFPGLKTANELVTKAPARLDPDQKREWAAQRYERDLADRHDAITARLRLGALFSAAFSDGELVFSIGGVPVIDRIFVSREEGEFILAQWKVRAATLTVTERTNGKMLAKLLRRLAVADNSAVVQQVIALEAELSSLDSDIARQEGEMNDLVYRLYELTEADKRLVQKNSA
jgi:tRNA G10  N-methylase Trm11